MGAHLIDGEFQSDKYPTTPRGKVPLSTKDPSAQDLLWRYAQRHRPKDAEFSDDLEKALVAAGFTPDALLHMGDVVEGKKSGRIGRVTGYAHDGTTDVLVDGTGPYRQSDLTKFVKA